MENKPLPQLEMRIHLDKDFQDVPLGPDMTIHTLREGGEKIWEWIFNASFGGKFDYDVTMKAHDGYDPEGVFFVKEYMQDIASSAAFTSNTYPGEGYVHMVGTHPWCTGKNAGKAAIVASLKRLKAQGYKTAVLTTDDFRLPAIHEYLELGFEPIIHEGDESMANRWKAIYERLGEYKKTQRAIFPCVPGAESTLKSFLLPGSKGVVIVCPGGGYTMKASHEGDPIAAMLNAAGISAMVLDYRVEPYSPAVSLQDAQRAIRVARSMGYEKVAIMGFSAGGHLSCMAATHFDDGDPNAEDPVERYSCRPDAFIPCYPLVSVRDFAETGFIKKHFGVDATKETLDYFSAECNVTRNTPPAFIWHTVTDRTVPFRQSLLLAEQLEKMGVPFEMHLFAEGPHGLGLAGGAPGAEDWTKLAQIWLLRQGFGKENQ